MPCTSIYMLFTSCGHRHSPPIYILAGAVRALPPYLHFVGTVYLHVESTVPLFTSRGHKSPIYILWALTLLFTSCGHSPYLHCLKHENPLILT